jgi:hypothetical protein
MSENCLVTEVNTGGNSHRKRSHELLVYGFE